MIRKLGLIVVLLVAVALLASGCTQQLAGNNTTNRTVTATATPRVTTTTVGGAGGIATNMTAVTTVPTTRTTIGGLGNVSGTNATGTLGTGVGNIMEVLQADGRFTKFVQALQITNLDDRLTGSGQTYTVFAPTDSAFDTLPTGAFESLAANPTGQLTQILLYHIATPGLDIEGLENIGSVSTLQGGRAIITRAGVAGANNTTNATGTTLRVDDAKIIDPDIAARNGVIHAIDSVLMPTITTTTTNVTGTVTPETTSTLTTATTTATATTTF